MSKAILVVDVDDKYLGKEISFIKFSDGNAIFCSEKLKPLPNYKINSNQSGIYKSDLDRGYDNCLEELLGGNDE